MTGGTPSRHKKNAVRTTDFYSPPSYVAEKQKACRNEPPHKNYQPTMKLFLADDNIAFRNRLASILSGIDGVEIVGSAEDVSGAIAAIEQMTPDAVILDLHMPGGSGFDVLPVIKSAVPPPTVIVLTVGPRNAYQSTSYAMGADYFFDKASDLQKMVRAIRTMAKISAARSGKRK
jgi:DNA-binding NarL/FixJ family response regulator